MKLLSGEKLKEMGLRPFELSQYPIKHVRPLDNEVITLSDFYFAYQKDKAALHIPSLVLPKHSVIALIGHNGAGKSTLARCLCGLEKHCRGIVSIAGKQYNRKRRLRYCYMVMQDVNHQLFTESVNEEVLLSMKNPDADQVSSTLKELDLDAFSERHPMSLSGGQKQRVAIARALVNDPQLIIADEPTGNLDSRTSQDVLSLMKITSQKFSQTIVMITHNEEIAQMADRILRIEDGRIVSGRDRA